MYHASIALVCECCESECRPFAIVDGYSYYRCPKCGYTFLPGPLGCEYTARVYDDGYFSQGGFGYANYFAERSLQRAHGHDFGRLLSRYAEPGTLLDVGCASGATLQGFADAGWRGEGLEPNGSIAAIARHDTGMNVYLAALEDTLPLLNGRFDAIAMIQVVAHFRNAAEAFRNAAQYVRSGGLLLIETWNAASLTARMFGRQWHELSPPATVRIVTPKALELLMRRFGFSLLAFGRPKKRILASHLKSLAAYKRRSGAVMAAIGAIAALLPDDLPIWYPAEDAFWHLYRRLP